MVTARPFPAYSAGWLPACTDTQGYSVLDAELFAPPWTWVGPILKLFKVLLGWLGKSPHSRDWISETC